MEPPTWMALNSHPDVNDCSVKDVPELDLSTVAAATLILLALLAVVGDSIDPLLDSFATPRVANVLRLGLSPLETSPTDCGGRKLRQRRGKGVATPGLRGAALLATGQLAGAFGATVQVEAVILVGRDRSRQARTFHCVAKALKIASIAATFLTIDEAFIAFTLLC